MWKTRRLRPRPAGSPEAPPSARACLRLPRASASLGQSAAWAALAGHIGLVFHIGQPLAEKLRDGPGLRALAAQTALDLAVLSAIYLPTFYVFKAAVFSGSAEPSVWLGSGLQSYQTNFAKDEFDLLRVWLPADIVCFSVPLYLRLPVRHVVSFVWTAYLSFSRGGH